MDALGTRGVVELADGGANHKGVLGLRNEVVHYLLALHFLYLVCAIE
jgi:hypothetical protein